MIIDQPLQGKRCTQLLKRGYAAETLRVIRPPRGLNFKPVSQTLPVLTDLILIPAPLGAYTSSRLVHTET